MSEPTPLELAEIRAGIDVLTEDSYHQPWSDEWALEMKRDLYRVVAEVERLRAENERLQKALDFADGVLHVEGDEL